MAKPYTKKKVDALLAVYTDEKEAEVKEWLGDIQHELLNWMNTRRKRIHSFRARMKERNHLRDKIERWPLNHEDGDDLTEENFFKKIEDLAGARILVLYRDDIAIVDHFVYRSPMWRVLKAEANYDETRPDDERLFAGLGFRSGRKNEKRLLKPRANGYASLHYTLVKNDLSDTAAKCSHRKCELQVRTIHEEAWGEFSHEFTYPHDQVDALASKLIRRLSGLLHQAEDIVSDIRRSPADARLFRKVHQQIWERPTKRLPPKITFDVVHEMLAEIQFIAQSAPLAAVGVLTKYGGKGLRPPAPSHRYIPFQLGKVVDADELITLGFGGPDDWGDDELLKLYLQAHKTWAVRNRKVHKFFVWPPQHDHDPRKTWSAKVPRLFREFSGSINFWLFGRAAYEHLQRVLLGVKTGFTRDSGSCLNHTQFFLWRTGRNYEKANLPCRIGMPNKVVGFYSPSPDPDLLGGMLWLPDAEDEEGRIPKALHAFAEVLLALKNDRTVTVPLVGDKIQVDGKLTQSAEDKIKRLVEQKFDGILPLKTCSCENEHA